MSSGWLRKIIRFVEERTAEDARRLWGQGPGERPRFNYRLEHVKAVVHIAEALGKALGADMEVVLAGAWLHDIAKRSGEGPVEEDTHGQESAAEARRLLRDIGFPEGKIEATCQAIEKHVGLLRAAPLENLEAAILWDADKLSKLGATAIVQHLLSRPALPSPNSPLTTETILEEGEKWLALAQGIAESMNTELGKEMARRRLEQIKAFYAELAQELRASRG